ncbi:MAG: GNAT family N-acetyltransferase [Meiothermus sp.]|nr:GNAT family N-acetyltransferase [Meiothermus sp.]
MMLTSRPYLPGDLEALTTFAGKCWQHAVTPSEFMCPGDVVWGVLQHIHYKPEKEMHIWEQDGVVAGFVLQKRAKFDPYVAPWLPLELRSELLRQMVAHAEAHAQNLDPQARLITSVARSNLETIGVVQSLGYAQDDFMMYFLERPLDDEILPPRLPEGFVVRHPEPHEIDERVGIHLEVWHPSRFTLESYLNIRSSAPLYRPDLDLVTVTPEGRFASYCIVWYDPVNQNGEFEPVGTRPGFERRGLGRAVLTEGFRRLKALGAKTAYVACEPDTLEFYQSAGFKEINQWLDFSKTI